MMDRLAYLLRLVDATIGAIDDHADDLDQVYMTIYPAIDDEIRRGDAVLRARWADVNSALHAASGIITARKVIKALRKLRKEIATTALHAGFVVLH